MSSPMFDIPEHLAMAVDADGHGPVDGTVHAVAVVCWCGNANCTKYGPVDCGSYAPTTCMRCGVTGICTPENDYYATPLFNGKVCEPCLLTLARRKP